MERNFTRIAIANRGEPAMRFIHAVREYNQEFATALRTIALFTAPDKGSMFVREADEAYCIGPAQSVDPDTGQLRSSYVDYKRLHEALCATSCDAVWPGWGFVAEHAAFADFCEEIGVVFIGPHGDVMRNLGDKIRSKLLAERAGIRVAPWSGGAVETCDEAQLQASRLGFPLMIKATAGGGGHGIRRVTCEDDLAASFESARAEAFKAFGDPTVFMESVVSGAHHVEVQILADQYGNTWALGVRDCTIQRRQQKVLEEAPSPVLSPQEDQALREAAVQLSRAARYENAGTVEFLYQPEDRSLSFLEMNTRLQVEHPVTECTTGFDIVKAQIHIARGGRLEGQPPATFGHAIEVRLNAEDPDSGFIPAPGVLERFRIPTGPGIRIDSGIAEGDAVASEFDSMIAKIIGYGRDRDEALARLQRALRDSVVVMRNGATNRAFLQRLLNFPAVRSAVVDVRWLDRQSLNGGLRCDQNADVALVQAAIESYESALAVERDRFYESASRGRPDVAADVGRSVALRYRGHSYSPKVYRLGAREYRIDIDDVSFTAAIERLGRFENWLTVFGRRAHVVSAPEGVNYRFEVDGIAHRIQRDDGGVVHAPAPAVVVSICVKPGDAVSAGDPIAVLEAMKMEMQITAPVAGTVGQVFASGYDQVEAGAALVRINPDSSLATGTVTADRLSFSGEPTKRDHRQELQRLRQLVLGFDVAAADISLDAVARAEARELEHDILEIFTDICALFHRDPGVDHTAGPEYPSAESYLFCYLQALRGGTGTLPAGFLDALRRAVAHYGVTSLTPSPELEESLLWIYKSHRRVEPQYRLIVTLLDRLLSAVNEGAQVPNGGFRELLDRMVTVTRGLYPALSDLARELRYRCFDQPVFEHARSKVYEKVEATLQELTEQPDSARRDVAIRSLIECPQPLVSIFASRLRNAGPALRRCMIEVLTGRYYRIRPIKHLQCFEVDRHIWASTEYDYEGKHIHLFATQVDLESITDTVQSIFPTIADLPPDCHVAIDLYVWNEAWQSDDDTAEQQFRAILNQAGFPRPIHRIVVAVAGPGRGHGLAGMQHFTYRFTAAGYGEDRLYRGLHPMMAKRLHLWRFSNFHLERLPSVEDVYLFRASARENPKDERLFACAEVRDLVPVRDESGRLLELPHLERMFSEAVAAMRLFQSRRASHQRLYWNRILLYIWPPLSFSEAELHHIVSKVAPSTEGLGLEQVVVSARIPSAETGELRDTIIRISGGANPLITFRPAARLQPLKPLSDYHQKVVRMRQRGFTYPYEIVKMLTPASEEKPSGVPPGVFKEYDLDSSGVLEPVDRAYGCNRSNIIVGVIRNFTDRYPEGMQRVMILGDPSRDLGALAEAECRRIIAALDMAEQMRVPVEWFAISAGAKISMESGVENMDWIARVLRRIVHFTQLGGEINIIVNGINVGAQPYWNAEATMLMHTRGILIMTSKAAMVLTGKRALDFSGSVSAEDNQGIGGYDRIMGFNGQAQYWADDICHALHLLLRHYDHTYVAAGERFPRRAATNDPFDRDVCLSPHHRILESGFTRVGEIFSDESNPGRKKPFDIRSVMQAVVDQDHQPLERWPGMRGAETAVVWDAHLGGYPVSVIGIESHSIPRIGFVPADGPEQWTAGTLFPLSSKKIARAINAASGNRPVVLLANLSGFDGSPESMRRMQLEYGAEIGRAVVNFKGPMIFSVVSRYHGGAYVVFSRSLNDNLRVVALEGTYASVIGGAPAAAVVFAGMVDSRTRADARVASLQNALENASGAEKARLRAEFDALFNAVHSETLGRVADEFDGIHSVHRALRVGALHEVLPPSQLRPYLIHAVASGVETAEEMFRAVAGGR